MIVFSVSFRMWSFLETFTHPSHANILGEKFQGFGIVCHALFGNQDSVGSIAGRSCSIYMVVVSSNLSPDVRFNAISCDDDVSFDPSSILELDSGLKFLIDFGNLGACSDIAACFLGRF